MTPSPQSHALEIVVLISGRGSNLRSIVDAIENKQLQAKIKAVISNNEHAAGLDFAKQHDIQTETLDHKAFEDRLSFDQAMIKLIDKHNPQLIVLAGFMRLLTPEFVNHYLGRLINIHPSLLPAYRGLNTHQRALEDKASEHGASVHFVTPELDGGPVIAQTKIEVYPNTDTADELAARVLKQEHQLYPRVISFFADKRLHMQGSDTIIFDGKVLQTPIMMS